MVKLIAKGAIIVCLPFLCSSPSFYAKRKLVFPYIVSYESTRKLT